MTLLDVDPEWLAQAQRAHHLLAQRQHVITNALRRHAEAMSEAAEAARASHATGADTSLISNQGFAQAGSILADTAQAERETADEIDDWMAAGAP
ncbi:hypothetical protein ABZ897_50885 [Nonomuraea sp. NPDC046802]|uniref:hypothetical protein n=1 Tax=Nonomuraea sp. NPDC046802 TaxID=3154919 RepID=UPI0033FA1C76